MRCLCLLPLGLLVLLITGVLAGLFLPLPIAQIMETLASAEIRFALRLTVGTSMLAAAIASSWVFPPGICWHARTFPERFWSTR
ncbi:hypothetical protein [Desulfosarcina cetonica]|uniref:hypothetical protein n=1 Tax=Desulfosarcina cetonica TaxID=90730 RepID=UPI0006D19A24|nr:hypothetical protein [Desulfosarcina cetonica]